MNPTRKRRLAFAALLLLAGAVAATFVVLALQETSPTCTRPPR